MVVAATTQTVGSVSSQVPLWIRTWTLVSSLVVIWVSNASKRAGAIVCVIDPNVFYVYKNRILGIVCLGNETFERERVTKERWLI